MRRPRLPPGRLLPTREVAERYAVHPRTLGRWEREGLLGPARRRGRGRVWGPADLRRLELVLTLARDLGVNRAGIEIILDMRDRVARLQDDVARLAELLRGPAAAPALETALVPLRPRPLVPVRRGPALPRSR